MRPESSPAIATCPNASPTSPITLFAPTRAASKVTVLVSEARSPVFFSFFPMATPGT